MKFDFVIDLEKYELLIDPDKYLSEHVVAIYGDFIDENGVHRLSSMFPSKDGKYPGIIIRKDIYDRFNGDIDKIISGPFLIKYIPELVVRARA